MGHGAQAPVDGRLEMERNGTNLDQYRAGLVDRVTSLRNLCNTLQGEAPGSLSDDQTRAVELLCQSLRKLQETLGKLKRATRIMPADTAERAVGLN